MVKFRNLSNCQWSNLRGIPQKSYRCGYCGDKVASNQGYQFTYSGSYAGGAYVCPSCNQMTLISNSEHQFPGSSFGDPVNNVPGDLNTLYNEARECTSNNSYTAAVLISRKILMTIAVELGAEENRNFVYYVDFLSSEGYVPPKSKDWVDHIRQKGNEANHEIHLMGEDDAKELITFIQMILKFNYEFPSMLPGGKTEQEEVDK